MARWASVPGFEGYYEVSDTGRVRSLDRVIHKPYRSGNRLSNLRWGSHADNAADSARHGLKKGTRHHGAKLDNRKVRSIRLRYAAGEGMTALAEQYGVTHTTIGRVVRRSGWGHIP